MIWKICFYSALAVWLIAIVLLVFLKKTGYKSRKILSSFNVVFASVVLSSFSMFLPIYAKIFEEASFGGVKTFFISLHNTIRLFVGDGEFSFITEYVKYAPEGLAGVYSLVAAVLYFLAPVLTFGFVLSFFKNISAYKNYLLSYFSDLYVFSDLNEKSLILAEDLKKNDPKRTIVFTDVFETNDEPSYEGIKKAMELGAIMFKKDIAMINYKHHSKSSEINFFIMGEDDDENVQQTYSLWEKYKDREQTSLYIFTTSKNSELLFNTLGDGEMKIRRINEVYSLISRHLYDNGIGIFENAQVVSEKERTISAVIVGLGQQGMEMLKALVWFCQMDGYRLEINAFDSDPNVKSRFESMCPELMDEKHNGDFTTKGEAHYKINIHSAVDLDSLKFKKMLRSIPFVTYVFVGLEDDNRTIETTVEIRTQLLKNKMKPMIDAVVQDTGKCRALTGITNFKGKKYAINFIGDMETSYSEKVVLYSDIEKEALVRHLRWGEEKDFWNYEYNYRSSIASAIHKKMKIMCGIPGALKEVSERTEEELWGLRDLEHRRWNAYMRSIGYTYAEERDDMAKTHHCLVPFDELPLKEQEKDDD